MGVIWRNNVVEGSHVIAGNEPLQVLDCRDLFVDILVSEVDYDEIYPGRDAQIRLLGRSDALDGKVSVGARQRRRGRGCRPCRETPAEPWQRCAYSR